MLSPLQTSGTGASPTGASGVYRLLEVIQHVLLKTCWCNLKTTNDELSRSIIQGWLAQVTLPLTSSYLLSGAIDPCVRVVGRECRHEAQQRGERPCSALGYCLTPGDPKAANDPQLNEPDAVRFYAVGASQMLAEHWDSLFKVLGPCAYLHAMPALWFSQWLGATADW